MTWVMVAAIGVAAGIVSGLFGVGGAIVIIPGLVLLLMASWNLVWGFFEILNDYYFSGDTLMAGSHSLWGWLYITVGACQLLLVPLVFARNPTGVFLAIVVVAINAVSHLLGFGPALGGQVAMGADAIFAIVQRGDPAGDQFLVPTMERGVAHQPVEERGNAKHQVRHIRQCLEHVGHYAPIGNKLVVKDGNFDGNFVALGKRNAGLAGHCCHGNALQGSTPV